MDFKKMILETLIVTNAKDYPEVAQSYAKALDEHNEGFIGGCNED